MATNANERDYREGWDSVAQLDTGERLDSDEYEAALDEALRARPEMVEAEDNEDDE